MSIPTISQAERDIFKVAAALRQAVAKINNIVDDNGNFIGGEILGTTTNDSAAAGYVGEYLETRVASGSAVSLTTNVAANLASRSLSAGDFDVWVTAQFAPAATTEINNMIISISETSATLAAGEDTRIDRSYPSGFVPVATQGITIGPVRKSLSATTTIYAVARSGFTVSTLSVYGVICARRVR